MKQKSYTGWIIFGIFVAIVVMSLFWLVATYNGLAGMDESVNQKWAQVETVYQRRMDLIPNIVNTVKGVANFEQSTYIGVAEARTKWLNAKPGSNERVEASNQFDSALSRLLVTVEAYPQLKANENFIALQDELANTENKISVERSRYNDAVQGFNAKIRLFPTNLIAGLFGFERRVYFEASAGAENAPLVQF